MDLVDYSQEKFDEISKAYAELTQDLSFTDIKYIPMSALEGDNVVNASEKTPWYEGGTLMENLESIDISDDKNKEDFRFPVQYVNRPHLNFRGFCGQVVSGTIKPGDSIVSLPSGKESKVKELVTMDGNLEEAFPPLSITITTEDEIDISRGDMIVKKDNQPKLANRVVADVVWMDEQDLVPNREYYFKVGTKETAGVVENVEYLVDVNTQEKQAAEKVSLNEIARVSVRFNQEVAVDAYQINRATGAFIFIDKLTNVTVGAGMIDSISEASENAKVQYSSSELELNAFVRKHYPHWGARDISQG